MIARFGLSLISLFALSVQAEIQNTTPTDLQWIEADTATHVFQDRTTFAITSIGDFAGYQMLYGFNSRKDLLQTDVYVEFDLTEAAEVYLLRAQCPERQWMIDAGFAASTKQGISNTTDALDVVTVATLAAGRHVFYGCETGTNNYVLMFSGSAEPPPPPPPSGSITVTWIAPTENECGPETPTLPPDDPNYCPPLDDLAGFSLYYGDTTGGPYPTKVSLTDPTLTAYTLTDLPQGDYYLVATAFDTSGNESGYSNEAFKALILDAGTPAPPGSLAVTGTTAYSIVKQPDGVLLIAIGDVAPGTVCDETQSVNGKYVVPTAAVTWYNPMSPPPIVVVADCS